MTVKERARNAIYQSLYAVTGPGRGLRVILLYHSVGSEAPHSLPVDIFERQMEALLGRFDTARLRDLPETLASISPDTNLACVTFDDGYRDNYEHALPVLERLGIRATFFIATGYLGKSFPTFAGEFPMMTSREVRELAALGHEIGAHTVTHPKLTKVSLETAHAEIETSKHFLEDLLHGEVISFAYPKGNHNEAVRALLGPLGFKLAVTIREGLVDGEPDWLALPRVWVSRKLSMRAFLAKTSPAIRWYTRLQGWKRWNLLSYKHLKTAAGLRGIRSGSGGTRWL